MPTWNLYSLTADGHPLASSPLPVDFRKFEEFEAQDEESVSLPKNVNSQTNLTYKELVPRKRVKISMKLPNY